MMGKEQIAESLSMEVVKILISTILTYSVKALIENVFRYNDIGGKRQEYNKEEDVDEN